MQNKYYTKLSFSFVIIDSHLIYKIQQENLKGKSIIIINNYQAKTRQLCPEYYIDLFNENLSHLSKIFVSQEDKTVVNSTSVKMSEASTSKDQEDQDKNIVNATEKSGMDGVNMS